VILNGINQWIVRVIIIVVWVVSLKPIEECHGCGPNNTSFSLRIVYYPFTMKIIRSAVYFHFIFPWCIWNTGRMIYLFILPRTLQTSSYLNFYVVDVTLNNVKYYLHRRANNRILPFSKRGTYKKVDVARLWWVSFKVIISQILRSL
jgi:hypothetical protein